MRRKSLYSLFVLMVTLFCNLAGRQLSDRHAEAAEAVVIVSDFKELKRELEAPGDALIELKASIAINEVIYVRGNKKMDGKGYTLSRGQNEKEVFGGTFLNIQGGHFLVRNVTMSGAVKDTNEKRNIYGRLLDVQKGEVTLETGTILKDNGNARQNNDGGGAIRIKNSGYLMMNHGEISGNQNVYGGAAIHVEKGGSFIMKGGTISDNRSYGIGDVEGFDGRGGAVYNQGKATISGGSICRNRVKGYTNGGISYGGVGGMLYNQGECYIQGGTLTGNSASYGGGAVYNDHGSKLWITGGSICDNEADQGEGLFLAGGSCSLGGSFTLSSVYMVKGTIVTAENSLSLQECRILILPENYKKGICVVKTQGKKEALKNIFSLKRKGNYILVSKTDGLYVEEKEEKVNEKVSSTKTGEAKREAEKPAKKAAKKPERKSERKPENALRKNAVRESGNTQKEISFETAPRFLFVWEVTSYTEERWQEELLSGCKIWYGDYKKEEIRFRWHWDGLLRNSAGSYQVELSSEGGSRAVIPVTLVQESTEIEKTGYVRFQTLETESGRISDEKECRKEEVWQFDRKDILDIKRFMMEREDPFSRETNQEFLNRYQKCQISREESEL